MWEGVKFKPGEVTFKKEHIITGKATHFYKKWMSRLLNSLPPSRRKDGNSRSGSFQIIAFITQIIYL